jgi:predicted esterase
MNAQPALRISALLIVTWGLASAAAAQSPEMTDVARRFAAAYEAQDWPRAIELGRKLHELAPREPAHAYNVACCYALSGARDEALAWVKKAAELGFSDAELVRNDPDLKRLHGSPEFESAVARIEENQAEAHQDLAARAARSAPILLAPRAADPSKPAILIIALHPYGRTAADAVAVWRALAAEHGAVLAAPQAFNKTGDGYQWGDTEQAEALVDAAIDKARASYKIDEQRIVLTGFSQGGMMAYNLAARHPERFRGVIPVAGLYEKSVGARLKSASLKKPKFFIMVGAEDRVVESNREAARDLAGAGAPTELAVYEGVGHAFPRNRDAELRKALRFVLED